MRREAKLDRRAEPHHEVGEPAHRRARPADDGLERTAELVGDVAAVPLPFRAPTRHDIERSSRVPVVECREPVRAEQLDGTLEMPDEPLPPSLPFVSSTSDADLNLDATAALPEIVISAALPFRGAPSPSAALSPSAISPPADRSSLALTLEQHASLTAELALDPDDQPRILARYGLTPTGRAEVDLRYRAVVQRDPALRSRWQAAYETYLAWLRARR